MAIWYLDTSAFLKLLVAEEHSAALRRHVRSLELWSSTLLGVEAHRAAPRLDLETDSVTRALSMITIVVPAETTYSTARTVGVPELRTLDALHLASALEFGVDLAGVLTYDRRLAAGCEYERIAVEAPGLHPSWWK